jgi:hypothetical protein
MLSQALRAAAFAFSMITAGSAIAASGCYVEVEVPASLECQTSSSKSADFSSGCDLNATKLERIEIACPGKWVNAEGSSPTHSATCAAVGLAPTTIDGAVCASGAHRPTSGMNAESISYRYGQEGSARQGGNAIVSRKIGGMRNGAGDGDDERGGRPATFCERNGQTASLKNVYRAVAFACQ